MTSTLPYQNPSLPLETRLNDLLERMTLAEKCAQLVSDFGLEPPDGQFSAERMRQLFPHGIGLVNAHQNYSSRSLRENVRYFNAIQAHLRNETRLGIPALVFGEGLHGYMANGTTSFPQAIALASAWDVDLHERIFQAVACEMRAGGAHYALSPVLDVARDARWGRTEETYGEDPYLVSRLGAAAIRGLQGEAFTGAPDKVLATAKHFIAHGQPEGGMNCAPANYAERMLREELYAPFETAVREANVGAVMASYNEINGIPVHANPALLKDLLRGEWGFDGLVLSDGWGVDELHRLHFIAADAAEAAQKALSSGVQAELGQTFLTLEKSVEAGKIPLDLLDVAAKQILRVKFLLGLFENSFTDEETAVSLTNSAEHRALALEAARKSIVLLKNENNLLPLDKAKLRSLAVIGPNAAAVRLGGYSGNPSQPVSVLDGIRQKVGDSLEILYAEGCGLTQTAGTAAELWQVDEAPLADPTRDAELIAEAAQIAEHADVILLALGDNEQTCREAWAVNHLGDRDSLDLPGSQEQLLKAVAAVGKPVILLLLNGRPPSINFAAKHIPAILEGWYLGQEGGLAVAEILFGETNPSGKLPITFPRSVGQIPAYYYHKPSAKRGYAFSDSTPLFPFGHGLSYTTFAYGEPHLDKQAIHAGESATLTVEVTNTGQRAGEEVVQLYIRDVLSERVTRPVKLLKGFQRILLQPGESQIARFTIGREHLQYLDENMRLVVEPGEFLLMVGGSSVKCGQISLCVKAAHV